MYEVLFLAALMALIFGLAALILFVIDRLTLRRGLTEEEHEAVLNSRTERWKRRWKFAFFLMAFMALFVSAFNLDHESMVWRVVRFVVAAFVVLGYLASQHEKD